jgi:cytochrome c
MKCILASAMFLLAVNAQSFAAEGNAARGQRVFGACAACHSLRKT